jgi:ribonuclease D
MPADDSPTFVTKPAELSQLATRLAQETMLGVDTESNSLHAYRERLCLLQFSTPKEDALVDPLAVEDLSPLAAVFSDAGIEKIFHAAEYDLIVIQRDYGFPFANLFDTMMAARILSRKKVGLGNMLEAEFGIKVEKRFQRADWGQRPLTQPLLDYARMDTHHLIDLRNKLKAELEERGRWELAKEDFERLPQMTRANHAPEEAEAFWRVKGARDLNPRQAAILRELAHYRETKAAEADVPLFKIIGDGTLVDIAKKAPHAPDELKEIAGVTDGQMGRHGKELLDGVVRGENAPPLRRLKRPPYDEAFADRLEKLRVWRKNAAKEMDVESDVVLPRDIMYAVANANPTGFAELETLLAQVPWRLKTYGTQILGALHPE